MHIHPSGNNDGEYDDGDDDFDGENDDVDNDDDNDDDGGDDDADGDDDGVRESTRLQHPIPSHKTLRTAHCSLCPQNTGAHQIIAWTSV